MGIMQFNKQNHERAKDELQHILQLLNNYLRTKTYLVGERITLADIAVASDLLLLFQWVKNEILVFLLFQILFI
jgi:elongation factor 1-gamma